MLVLLLFFCSGISALVYEVLWSKYLTLMLGSTVQAQTVVLAVFMGGLAIGNRLFGAKSRAVAEPLRLYGFLELIIGLYAFFFPRLYNLGDAIFVKVGSAFVNAGALLFALKLFLSVLLLLFPTVLMGGTLPVLAAWIQKGPGWRPGEESARVGIFYAINSLGAVAGAALAGFFLVQNLGMLSSVELTALGNLLVGLVALVLAKREQAQISAEARTRKETVKDFQDAAFRSFAWLVALTGGVSMGLEVLSSRALALIVGGSLQAFALVLMSFILGIGLGSAVISSSQAARKYGWTTVYGLLIAAGVIVVANVLLIEHWTVFYTQAKFGLAANHAGYRWHQLAVAVLAFLMLGIPAACLGAVVPLTIRLANVEGAPLGDEVGRLLTWNTIGAVVGVLATGFFLMPVIGLRGALATIGIAVVGVAGGIAHKRAQRPAFLVAAVLFLAAIIGTTLTGKGWQSVVGVGLYRVRSPLTYALVQSRKELTKMLFYKDAADATVSIEEAGYTNNSSQVILRINGKTDASSLGDLPTQYLLAHLPMMARPDAKQAFVLGFGSGITSGALMGHPIERLTIAENCKPVLEGAHLFGQWNRGVYTNSRVRIRNDDARAVLKLSPEKYDIIISEPSNPWVVGIGSVFSQEFYQLCANRLSEGGIMAQWFHRYEMSDSIVFLVVRTFASIFPNMEIWDAEEGDLILLGSKTPWKSDPEQYEKVFARPEPRKDLAAIHLNNGAELWTRQVASQRIASAIAGDGPVQTDEFPILEYAAPEAFFIGFNALGLYRFDERTMQFTLADTNKVAALRALPDNALLDLYAAYGISIPDMKLYFTALANRANGGLQRIDPLGHIIYRAADSYPEHPPIPTNATPEFKACLEMEAKMLRDDSEWKRCAAKIAEVLTKMISEEKLKPADFSPTYYAALVTRFAIAHDDYETALRTLRLGFVFSMTDEQLTFLSRVVDRIVPPKMMQEFKALEKS
ncbi:MAG TPA: fused MFS/spermidine synthase [Verrucomicrobiae bacterium]|jgi:spermidine synthase|nr:fused MFS/spermidine synthase [Verrucomicrobiae bacterium]